MGGFRNFSHSALFASCASELQLSRSKACVSLVGKSEERLFSVALYVWRGPHRGSVIMADPPWDIHMELPYGTMEDEQMRKLGVSQLQVRAVL